MIPLYIITFIEKLAFDHSKYDLNNSKSSVLFALAVFTVTCVIIIALCYIFEKPDEITVSVAKSQDDEVPTYYEEWEDEDPFIVMRLIYGLISLIGLYFISDAMMKSEPYLSLFKKYAVLLIVIDLIITVLMKREIAPNIHCSVIGMIHFETSYMLRAVWIIAFIWGLLYFTVITILIGGIILALIT